MRILSNWQAATIVGMFFVMPHIALRYSSIALVGGLNAFFNAGIFLLFSIIFIYKFNLNRQSTVFALLLLFTFAYGVIKGMAAGAGTAAVLKAGYETIGPLALFALIIASGVTAKNLHRGIIKPVLIVSLINGIYTAYQYFFLTDYRSLWFYKPLTALGYQLNEWSFESHGVIRGVGIFTSPLENVYLILFTAYYFAVRAKDTDFKCFLPLVLCLFTGYLTGVRTFFVALIVGLIGWFVIRVVRKPKAIVVLFFVPLIAIAGTYVILLIHKKDLDLSALGRLKQLAEMAGYLSQQPFGFGLASVGIGRGISFDSANGAWLISYGLLGGAVIIFLYFKLATTLLGWLPFASSADEHNIFLALVLFATSLPYLSQFQYALMTPGRWYFVFASAVSINHLRAKIISSPRSLNNAHRFKNQAIPSAGASLES